MKPGFRRRILIEPGDSHVTAELEDDYHRMAVTLRHAGGTVHTVESVMKRAPWTQCPGAIVQLAETFTGVALADCARRGAKTQNCTHLHDLTVFAAAHAAGDAAVAYDIHITDPVDGVREARLVRDGAEMLRWTLAGDRILAPAALAGVTLGGLGEWIAAQGVAHAEAGRILRWAAILAHGRGMDMPAGIPATPFPTGACFNFQPSRAVRSTRCAGADMDFSVRDREPLADRAPSFRTARSAP